MLKAAAILAAILIGIAFIAINTPRELPPHQIPSAAAPAGDAPPTTYSYEVVHEYPHDPDVLTQGLIYHDGFLYESTGLLGQSSIRKVRLETGEVIQRRAVDGRYA